MPPQLDLCAVEAQTLGREGLVGRGRYGRKEIMLNTDKEVFLKFLATEAPDITGVPRARSGLIRQQYFAEMSCLAWI